VVYIADVSDWLEEAKDFVARLSSRMSGKVSGKVTKGVENLGLASVGLRGTVHTRFVPQLSSLCAASFLISSPGWNETDADLRGLLPESLPSDERETHLARAIFLASVLSLIVKSCYPLKGCILPRIAL